MNEFARQSTGESPKGAQTRALLFDISFLMLCHIAMLYRSEVTLFFILIDTDSSLYQVIFSSPEAVNSLFVQWVTRCLPENGHFKSAVLQQPPDQSKVDMLIGQLKAGELKTGLTKWSEVIHHMPFVIQAILTAWEAQAINEDRVKVGLQLSQLLKPCSLFFFISGTDD